jgi:hypothetical protein
VKAKKKKWIQKMLCQPSTMEEVTQWFGAVCYAGVGELAIVEGIMNAKGYVNILRGNLKKSVRKLGIKDSYLFQQDNDPKHTARITREWLLYNARGLMETPPQLQILIR